jgi:hypothetical protein
MSSSFKHALLHASHISSSLAWVTLQLTISQSVSQSVRLGLEPLCDSWPDCNWRWTIMGLMSWGVFPDGRTVLSSFLDLLLESSSLDSLESSMLDTLLKTSSLDPLLESYSLYSLWSLLVWVNLTLNLSYLQLTVSQSVGRSVGRSDRPS